MPLLRFPCGNLRIPDLDRVFCYDTPKLLRCYDFKPGLVYRAGIVFIILYCIGFVLVVNQRYLEQSCAVGVATVEMAPSYDKLIPSKISPDTPEETKGNERRLMEAEADKKGMWDRYDLVFPPTEVGGFFIPTRVQRTTGQTMKACPDKTSKFPDCKKKMPIYSGLKYPGSQNCMEYTWCPKFGQGGVDSTQEDLDSEMLGEVELVFNLHLNWFPLEQPAKFVSHSAKMKLSEIMKLAEIKDIAEVQKTGCVIYTQFSFGSATKACGTADKCEPELQVLRLDDPKDKDTEGFRMRRATYYRGNGTLPKEMRDVSRVFGIRIVATASGYGETFSVLNATLQVASCLAMWQLVYFVADLFCIYLNLKALKYYPEKFVQTPDFGKLKAQEEAAKIDAQANQKGKRPRRNRARLKASGEEEEEEE